MKTPNPLASVSGFGGIEKSSWIPSAAFRLRDLQPRASLHRTRSLSRGPPRRRARQPGPKTPNPLASVSGFGGIEKSSWFPSAAFQLRDPQPHASVHRTRSFPRAPPRRRARRPGPKTPNPLASVSGFGGIEKSSWIPSAAFQLRDLQPHASVHRTRSFSRGPPRRRARQPGPKTPNPLASVSGFGGIEKSSWIPSAAFQLRDLQPRCPEVRTRSFSFESSLVGGARFSYARIHPQAKTWKSRQPAEYDPAG
ncbi:MAG: hypothetical protein IPJ77_22515 [Planctomycetes bacterium]|nr:hypothetical protein [Planctomycetota bacterium]